MTVSLLADQAVEQLDGPAHGSRHHDKPRRYIRPGSISFGVGAVIIVALYGSALFLPLPYSPEGVDSSAVLQAPSATHWAGTDSVGADVFSRTIAAGRVDLTLTFVGTAISLFLGVTLGLAASTRAPWAERFMRFLDAFQALPLLVVTLALVTVSGRSLAMVAVTMAMICGPLFIRLVRSQALTVRESRYVEAGFAAGAGWGRVMRKYVLPNIRPLIFAQTAQVAGIGILLVAGLSFLGIGVAPPTPSWGALIQEGGTQVIQGRWWLAAAPGAAIFLCVLAFNLMADGLRDLFTARVRKGA
jgi:peptide/nickel transport system permease protein